MFSVCCISLAQLLTISISYAFHISYTIQSSSHRPREIVAVNMQGTVFTIARLKIVPSYHNKMAVTNHHIAHLTLFFLFLSLALTLSLSNRLFSEPNLQLAPSSTLLLSSVSFVIRLTRYNLHASLQTVTFELAAVIAVDSSVRLLQYLQ